MRDFGASRDERRPDVRLCVQGNSSAHGDIGLEPGFSNMTGPGAHRRCEGSPDTSQFGTVLAGGKVKPLRGGLVVIEVLVMRESLCRTQNVNGSGHRIVNQAFQLVVTGFWKRQSEGLSLHHRRGAHASGAVEGGATGRKSRASRPGSLERRVYLSKREKSQSVNFVALECPGDAVAGVNPNFIGKKRESLLPHVIALAADGCVPGLLGLNGSRDTEKRQYEQPQENL